jgi:hypothetical protein
MGRLVSTVLREQHHLLRAELTAWLATNGLGVAAFDLFRHHLLWNVSVEERVVMPALIRALGRPPDDRPGLRKDHAGIAALCVPRPEREWVENLRDLLDEHYRVEEKNKSNKAENGKGIEGALGPGGLKNKSKNKPVRSHQHGVSPRHRGPVVASVPSKLLRMKGAARLGVAPKLVRHLAVLVICCWREQK